MNAGPDLPPQTSKLTNLLAGTLAGTAVAIMCMPCARTGGYFAPTSDLVLADLTGRRDPHPVFGLAHRLTEHPPGAPRVLALFDDLDVERNWMLPPDAPRVADLWPAVRSAARAVLPVDAEVALLSEWLHSLSALDAYEHAVAAYANKFMESLASGEPTAARWLMSGQLARRRRFAPPGGGTVDETEIRVRAARHLANYAVQGQAVVDGAAAIYLLGGEEEAEKMSVFAASFRALAAPPSSRSDEATEGSVGLVASAIPAPFAELRGSLPLYLDDLPATPGAVMPGLAADIVTALGKLLTPGVRDAGAAEISALNNVLSGGPANKQRVTSILNQLLPALATPATPASRASYEPASGPPVDDRSLRSIEHTARKVFAHLASRWDDDALTEQHQRHRDVIAHLAAALDTTLGEEHSVALALTGSFTSAPGGWWHPYLSDIDVMPLRYREPSPAQIADLQEIYDATPRPPWVYLNIGACIGVGGLTRDPRTRFFVAEYLPTLDSGERRLLGNLLAASRFLAGDRGIYDAFLTGYAQIRANTQTECPP